MSVVATYRLVTIPRTEGYGCHWRDFDMVKNHTSSCLIVLFMRIDAFACDLPVIFTGRLAESRSEMGEKRLVPSNPNPGAFGTPKSFCERHVL